MQSTLDLDQPYTLSAAHIANFRRDGFVHLPAMFQAEEIAAVKPAIDRAVERRKLDDGARYATPIAQRNLYDQAFLQIMNLWVTDPETRALSFSKRLARAAAELLGCSGVRMYHDQALYKEPGGGFTPWHTDQVYWPLADHRSVTAWIPLQAVSDAMGPLEFAAGSQHILENRDLKISAESEQQISKHMTLAGCNNVSKPFALGEVSFHYGWTFHRAAGNTTNTMRAVMTVIYIAEDMRLKVSERTKGDAAAFCPGVEDGAVIDSPLNPVLWQR